MHDRSVSKPERIRSVIDRKVGRITKKEIMEWYPLHVVRQNQGALKQAPFFIDNLGNYNLIWMIDIGLCALASIVMSYLAKYAFFGYYVIAVQISRKDSTYELFKKKS